jgi:chemotaxis response regulator CheB
MNTPRAPEDFPVVCVGASAGGLQAYVTLLQHVPVDLGIAVVIVNHMRSAATTLHKILPRYTTMPVELITERLVIEPNRVYIIPENRELHILEGTSANRTNIVETSAPNNDQRSKLQLRLTPHRRPNPRLSPGAI